MTTPIDLADLNRKAVAAAAHVVDPYEWHIIAGDGAAYGSAVADYIEAVPPEVAIAMIARIRKHEDALQAVVAGALLADSDVGRESGVRVSTAAIGCAQELLERGVALP